MDWREAGYYISAVIILTGLILNARQRETKLFAPRWPFYILCTAGILSGIFARYFQIGSAFGGTLWNDEIYSLQEYSSSVLNLSPTRAGGTQSVFGFSLGIASKLSVSIPILRSIDATMCVAGGAVFFLVVRTHFGSAIAVLATLTLSLSSSAIYWSRFILDTSGNLFLIPFGAGLLTAFWQRPTTLLSVLCGSFFALSSFYYPGIPLMYFVCIVSAALMVVGSKSLRTASTSYLMNNGRLLSLAIAIGGCILLTGYYVHTHFLRMNIPFGVGGGSVEVDSYTTNLLFYVIELVLEIRSFFHVIPDYPFLEPSLLGLAIFGASAMTEEKSSYRMSGVFLLLVFCIYLLALPMTGQNPGIRRGLPLIFIFAIFAGYGAHKMLLQIAQSNAVMKHLCSMLLFFSYFHPLLFQYCVARVQVEKAPTARIPNNSQRYERLVPELRFFNLVFNERPTNDS